MSPRAGIAILLASLLVLAIVRVFHSPFQWAMRVILTGAMGLVALWGWDRLFVPHGWGIGLNPVTGATIGLLGPAGFLLLVAVKVLIL